MSISVHFSIDVPDLSAGLRFYGAVFGFVETARPFPTMAVLDTGVAMLCLHEKPEGSMGLCPAAKTGAGTRATGRQFTSTCMCLTSMPRWHPSAPKGAKSNESCAMSVRRTWPSAATLLVTVSA